MNPEITEKIDALNSLLLELDDTTGRRYTFILIPESPDEEIIMSLEGKPVNPNSGLTPEQICTNAVKRRESTQP